MQTMTAANDTAVSTIGSKFISGRDLAAIAKLVRADIKAAIAIGDLPAALKTTVQISRYSMGQSIDVRVTACGFLALSTARIRAEAIHPHDHCGIPFRSVRGSLLLCAIESIVNRFMDPARFGSRHSTHVSVEFDGDLTTAQRAEIVAAIKGSAAA